MEKNYEYEEDLDILYVHNNPSREKPIGNLVFGNILVDVGESGKVLGIEIDCPTLFFNIPTEQLENLRDAKILLKKLTKKITRIVSLTNYVH